MAKFNQAMTDLLRYNAAILPQKRSAFGKNHSHSTTLDSADLVPVMWDRVLPGDEKKIRASVLARMATPIHPTMDEARVYLWAFYVPDRFWWNHAKEFYGENLDASFNPDGTYVMPSLKPSQYIGVQGTPEFKLNDYLNFPVVSSVFDSVFADDISSLDTDPNTRVSAGLHRSYQLIWNEYYRNTSIQPALQLNNGDTVTDAEWSVISQLRKVNKLPDMYTTLLQTPQAGDDVILPLGDWAPVVARNANVDNSLISSGVTFANLTTKNPVGENVSLYSSDQYGLLKGNADGYEPAGSDATLYPRNLWANLTSATAATINNLRAAITIQQLLETDAIAGKRYQNILQAHFGVFTPDATLQRPELLGATQTVVGMRQVLQTGATVDGVSPQGNAAAVSVTNMDNEWICNKSFTEPGFIMVLAAIRPVHSYSQGVDPLIRKLERYDHYWPVFENLGNQPVYASELYGVPFINGQVDGDNFTKVFGYKEAWQEYRMKPNRVSGLFRPDVVGTLASWNYSTAFNEAPLLNSEFITEDPSLIDRTIAVQNEPQFLMDCYFEYTDIKNMGIHSIPGLTRL